MERTFSGLVIVFWVQLCKLNSVNLFQSEKGRLWSALLFIFNNKFAALILHMFSSLKLKSDYVLFIFLCSKPNILLIPLYIATKSI